MKTLKMTTAKVLLGLLFLTVSVSSMATGSTQIWIPSTDIQAFGKSHLGIDNYIRTEKDANGLQGSAIYDFGYTIGVLPFNKLQLEIGADYISMGDLIYDNQPVYFNAKLGIPEDSLFKFCPALAIGAYSFGLKKDLTDYNITYALLAKTIPFIGRLSVGYYIGNEKLILDDLGNKANSGILLSWDRPMKEISDKLWLAVDYQGGQNYLGSLNIGFSWAFSSNVSVIIAYDIYNNKKTYYNMSNTNANSFTTQLDINF